MNTDLLAGTARTTITPPAGTDLGGYGGRPGPAEGIHDELEGAALCLEAGEAVVLVTADLVGIDRDSASQVREAVAQRTAVSASHVMLTCTHTHAGPAMPCLPTLGCPDPGYVEELKGKLTEVAARAWARRAPARAGAGRALVSIGLNRRDGHRGDGSSQTGTVQPHADVLRVDNGSGAPLAVWMCHPAHPVTLRDDNLRFSADWVGYARQVVERRRPGTIALFAQGCAGNIVSWPHDGTYELTQQQGEAFGDAAANAAESVETSARTQVRCLNKRLQLPLFDPPSPDEARAVLDECRRLRDEKWGDANCGWRQLLDGDVAWAEKIVRLSESGAKGLTADYEVQAIRVGDFALVGLDGEVFVEYALNLDRDSPFAQTAVAAYSNGNVGYVPTAAAYDVGGYEVDTAIRYYGTTMLRPDCEGMILDAAVRLLKQIGPGL